MNRVKQLLNQSIELKDSIVYTEDGYKGKRKGTIYYERMLYLKKKLESVDKQLKLFGRAEIKTWEILISMESGIPPKKMTLNLPGDITSDEIHSYLGEYINKQVFSVTRVKTIKLGFIG